MSNFSKIINKSIDNLFRSAVSGDVSVRLVSEDNIIQTGYLIDLGKNSVTSTELDTRKITSLAPEASVVIKKKAFSTLQRNNDLQWMSRTERMLLRATKALFAYKVSQIRAYESLTKLEDWYRDVGDLNFGYFAQLVANSKYLKIDNQNTSSQPLDILSSIIGNTVQNFAYDKMKEDVLKVVKRNAFSSDIRLTTWIVDPTDADQYLIGPGTGSIELTYVSSFNTRVGIETAPKNASFSLPDPYRILCVSEDDIEIGIQEALLGNIGLFQDIISGNLAPGSFDSRSVIASGVELLGLGSIDGTIDINYIRATLKTFYLGKSIINATDGVSFFVRSNKDVEGDADYYSVDDTIFEAERNLLTDKKIDLETYKKLRTNADNSFGMRHIYGGFVENSSWNYSNGAWTLDVSCLDNMGWLTYSKFMDGPSISDAAGILEDPLTPYEIRTDGTGQVLSNGGPQLLNENKELLKSGLLAYDSGIFNGQFATESNLYQSQYSGAGSLRGTKILQHPNGFVYKWKSGIITATSNISVRDPLNENEISTRTHRQYYGLTVAENVLTNLDVANVLSLLIVGQPYNIQTFLEQSYEAHNINKKSAARSLDVTEPLSAVLDVIRRNNPMLGNFHPYRMITMSNGTTQQAIAGNTLRTDLNEKIKMLRERRFKIEKNLRELTRADNSKTPSFLAITLREELKNIDGGIQEQINLARNSVTISGEDLISSNFNLFGRNRVLPLTGNFDADAQITRAMTIVGAQKRIEDVRLNQDQNLFIVSDQYEENTDIRPFILALKNSNFKIFKGTYTSTYEKCETAAQIVNFEFFCNSQGNLEFRPPQWNKTPLSILRKLMEQEAEGKKVVPPFLKNLFSTRAASLRRTIHKLNVKIALTALLLGKFPDNSLIPGMSIKGKNSLNFFGLLPKIDNPDLRDNTFGVSKSRSSANRADGDVLDLTFNFGDEGNILNGNTSQLLGIFDPIFQEENSSLQNVLNAAIAGSSDGDIGSFAKPSIVEKIRLNFRKSFGEDPLGDVLHGEKALQSHFVNQAMASESASVVIDESAAISKIERYFTQIQVAISERDKLVTLLNRNEEKERELKEIESTLSGEFLSSDEADLTNPFFSELTSSLSSVTSGLDKAKNVVKTLSDIYTGEATKGSLYDHLIEDDSRNLVGPGSGKRFIIDDAKILQATFTENKPIKTRVDVYGSAPFLEELQQTFNDRYYWAGGTDFDLWRQYGYIVSQDVNLPYASDPELQCRPFAYMELQVARSSVNQASISVIGDEYYEPGDVVYVPTVGLLYYVVDIGQNFSYGKSFATQLTLINGHPPGVYLPSPSDIIGQEYTRNALDSNILVYKNVYADDSYKPLRPDTSILFPPGELINESTIPVLLDFRDNQVRYSNMMIELSTLMIGERLILLRGFVGTDSDEDVARVRNNLKIIKEILKNPSQITQENEEQNRIGPTRLFDDLSDDVSSSLRGLGISTGTTKGLQPMNLPNGLAPITLSDEQFVEQIVYLIPGKEARSEIKCLNPKLLTEQKIEFRNSSTSDPAGESYSVTDDDIRDLFPKGGPKQKTWLDFRDDLTNIKNVIEVGILDLTRPLESGQRQ